MDLQQALALVVVAAAAVLVGLRMVRRRRTGKFAECAECVGRSAHQTPESRGKS
jgi:hypothetical protein